MNDEYKTLGQIITEPATQFGSRELDSGNPHAWSAEKEQQFEQDIEDVQRNFTVTTADLQAYMDNNYVSTGEKIALGLEQAGTQTTDAFRGLDQMIAKSPASFPALTEKEKDDMVALTMHNYEAFTKARQDLINRKGVADSVWFNGANVLGQVALTTVAGVLTGGSTVPIVMGGVQEFGRKSGDYALKYAQATGDYSLKDQSVKDDMIALAYAGISAAIERGIGAERVLDGVIANGALKQLGKAAIGEAAEEFTQEMTEYLSDQTLDLITNKSIYNDRTPMEAFKDALTGAVYGALGGGTMGFGMYYANRNALQRQFENAGYAPADAKQMAVNAVDTAKQVVLREIITRDQLEKKYGQAYTDLVNKVYNSKKETNAVLGVRPEKEYIGTLNLTAEQQTAYDAGQAVILNDQQLRQYAETLSSMLARQVIIVAAMQGTSTDMVLQLSDIEQIGNVVALNTPDMHNDVVVRRMQQQNKALQQKLKHERDLKKARGEGFQDEDDRIAILQSQQAALQRRLDELERQDQLDVAALKKQNNGIDISARAYADAAALKNATTAEEFYKNLTAGQQAITTTPEQIQARYEDAILADIAGSPKEFRRLFTKGKISPQVRANLLTNIATLRSTGLTGIQGDIKRALNRIAAGCTLDNFAITFGNIRDENDINPFATAFVTYTLLSDPAGATQTINLLAEKVNTLKQNIAAGTVTTQNQNRADIMSEALRESPLTADKWENDTTTDPNLLMLYDQKNVVNYAVQKAKKRAEEAQARIKAINDQYKIKYATDESLRKALLDNKVLNDPKLAQKYSHAALVKLFKEKNLSADVLEQKSAAELEQDTRNAQTRKAARKYKTVKSLFWSQKKMQYNINRQFAEDWGIDKAFGVDLKYFQKDGGIQDWAQIAGILADNQILQQDTFTDSALAESLDEQAKRIIEQNIPLDAQAAAQLDIAAEEERQRYYMESELLKTGNYTQDQLNKMDMAELDAALQDEKTIQAAAETDTADLPDIPFQEQTDGTLYQGKRKGGAFDPVTKQVILGRNSNTGTLPHEIAHFWLNELFNRMHNNQNLPAQGQAMWDGLKRMLNITDDQTQLTRDQHEQFATSAEAYIFNKTPLPKGTEPAYKDFLAYVPESYYTFMNMGWTGADGQFHNPMLTEDDMHWFDSFFTGTGIIESAPVQTKAVSSNEPVKVSIMDGRKAMLDDAQKKINNAGDKLETAVKESIPAANKVQISSVQNTIVKTADETLQMPAINNDDKPDSKPAFSFLHRGRGTDTREEQLELTRKWAQEHWDEALAFALTDPEYSTNPSPADPATLIRVVAELNTDMSIKDQLNTNFALMMSKQGKSGGLNNDTHNSFFLKGLGQIQQNLANKYALTRYGTTKDAVERFDIEVRQFVDKHIADLQAGRITVQDVMKQAAEIFGRDENADISEEINTLFQELAGQGTPKSSFVKEIQKVIKKKDETRQERITLADQLAKNGKLGEYLAHLVKVQAGAEMDTKTKAEFNAAATRAQVASTQLDSDDPDTATAAAQIIHEYHKRIGQTEIAQNWADKVIGGFESRAMLSGATTISKNLVGNEIELGVVTGALRSKYGQNDVDAGAMKAETDRLTKIYETSLLSIPQMENLTDKSLVHGEAYGIGENSVTVAGVQVRTIGNTKIPDPLAILGRSDFYFRRNVYLKSLAYQASAYARKNNLNATDVFNQWKKLSDKTPEGMKARKEAVMTAHTAVFTQNGALAEALNRVRNVLNRAVPLGTQYGLGNMIAPFVKTPANIVEMGARALASPFSSTWQYMKAGELDVAHRIDLGNLGVALLILAATVLAKGEYEPPYQPGMKYDPTKPYDSIRIAGVWIKLDTLGPLTTPLRLLLSATPGVSTAKNAWKRGVAGTFGDIPFDLSGVEYAITNPTKGGLNWVEGELDKAIPTIVSDWAKVGGHMSGITVESPVAPFGNKTIRKIGMDGQNPNVNDWIRAVGLGIIRIDENR